RREPRHPRGTARAGPRARGDRGARLSRRSRSGHASARRRPRPRTRCQTGRGAVRRPEGGPEMTARTARTRPARPTLRLAGAALAAAVLVAGCQGEPESATPAPPVTTEPGDESSEPSEPTEEPATGPTTDVPVYFMTDTRAGLRLAREVRETSGDEPVKGAVEAMLAGPEDPDYSSTWAPGKIGRASCRERV